MPQMRKRFSDFDILVGHEPGGLLGGGCITITMPTIQMTLRLVLEDAESLGEALIRMVRKAEETTT